MVSEEKRSAHHMLMESSVSERHMYERYTKHQPVLIEGEPDAQTVWLRVGVQSFCVGEAENEEHAIWRRLMLAKALTKIERNQGRNVCSNPEGCDSPTRCQSGCTHAEDKQ